MATKIRIPIRNQKLPEIANVKRIRILGKKTEPTSFLKIFSEKKKEDHSRKLIYLGLDVDGRRVTGSPGDELDIEGDLSLESARSLIVSGFAEPA